MELRNKSRDEINRLMSDRQAYISSLELRLEKFTQSTQSYLELKEKVKKIGNCVESADERITGLNWLVKQQSENHQQQIKSLTARYEELQQYVTGIAFRDSSAPIGKSLGFEKKSTQDYSKIAKELEELINISGQQLKNEMEQRFDIFSSKNNVFYKGLEHKIEVAELGKVQLKQEFEKELEKLIEKNCEIIKDFEYKFEAGMKMNLDRYKEVNMKIKEGTIGTNTGEIGEIRKKIKKFSEFQQKLEENEVRRELEVKEASQSAWNVESQVKHLEEELENYKSSNSKTPEFESLFAPYESRLSYLTSTVKKYLSVQKTLHKKVEFLASLCEPGQTLKKPPRKRSISNKSSTSNRSQALDSSYSPSLNSSRVSILKSTPKFIPRPTSQRSRIDILYDELSNMFP